MTQPARSTIDVATGGTLINKTEDEAYNLIEVSGLEVSLKLMHLLHLMLK